MTFFIMMNHDLGYQSFHATPAHRIREESGWIAGRGSPLIHEKVFCFTQIKPRQLT